MAWVGPPLRDILCARFERTVGKDNCVSFAAMKLQIPADRHRCHYVKAKVVVLRRADATLAILHGPRMLAEYTAEGRLPAPETQGCSVAPPRQPPGLVRRTHRRREQPAAGRRNSRLCRRDFDSVLGTDHLTTGFHYWKLVAMKKRAVTAPAATPGTAAITELALTVFRLNGLLLHWGDRLVEPLGLTSARWQMLGAIALAQMPLTAPLIGEAMGVTRQGAQKQLNLLLEQGLVETRSNPARRRSPFYALTPQGLALYRQADAMWVATAAELAKATPAAQALAATQTLESIQLQLQTVVPSPEIKS